MKTKPSPRLEQLEDRLTPSIFGQPWPDPGHLTLSFAPDGTNAGGAPSGLFNLLNAQDSTPNWETAILRAFQTWAVNTNVNVGLVNDGGLALGTVGGGKGLVEQHTAAARRAGVQIRFAAPATGLVSDGAGNFWGTTWRGGLNENGTVFKINASTGVLTTVVEFTVDGAANKGAGPTAGLVSDARNATRSSMSPSVRASGCMS